MESAVIGYKSILQSDESKLDPHIRDFVVDQITLCLSNAQQWIELRDFLRSEENRPTPRATIPLLSITSRQIENMILYLECMDHSVIELSDWESLNISTNTTYNDFSYHRVISLAENTICQMSIQPPDSQTETIAWSVIQTCLQECLRTRSREHLSHLTIMNHIGYKTVHQDRNGRRGDSSSFFVDKSFGSTTLTRLLGWGEFFDSLTEEGQQLNVGCLLDVCSMTRKEGNLTYCGQQLGKFFNKMGIAKDVNSDGSLEEICKRLITVPDVEAVSDVWNASLVRGVYETAKWLYCYPERKETAIQFAAANTIAIEQRIEELSAGSGKIRERLSRSMLTLSEWLQAESEKILMADPTTPLNRLVDSIEDISTGYNNQPLEVNGLRSIILPIDTAVGKLIAQSTRHCPDLAKAWGAYANWCYRWGRKIVELRTETEDKAGLRSNEIACITALIPFASVADIDQVVAILNQQKVSAEDEEITVSNSEETSSTEMIESLLRSIPILRDVSSDQLQKIIEIWRQAHRCVYSYYEMAAEAYFKYLQLATQAQGIASPTDDSNGDCSVVTATLRILRLIVKHALGLQEVLEDGLASTPTSPWKVSLTDYGS